MNLGRGFKYFVKTRFPETNLDLYCPRRLSTSDVIDIVTESSHRSFADIECEPDSRNSPSQLETIGEDTSTGDDEEVEAARADDNLERDEEPEEDTIKDNCSDLKTESVSYTSDEDDDDWNNFFKTKEEDALKLEV